jgi:hypothetical protein
MSKDLEFHVEDAAHGASIFEDFDKAAAYAVSRSH